MTSFRFLPRLVLLLSLLAGFGALPAAAQNARIALQVALAEGPATRSAGFLIAQQRGYFTDAGLDVTFTRLGYGRAPVEYLGEAQADLAVDIMASALGRREKGADVVHIAQIFQRATLALVCRSTVDQPTKLTGHNVGVWFDDWESSFYAWLSRLGAMVA